MLDGVSVLSVTSVTDNSSVTSVLMLPSTLFSSADIIRGDGRASVCNGFISTMRISSPMTGSNESNRVGGDGTAGIWRVSSPTTKTSSLITGSNESARSVKMSLNTLKSEERCSG